MGLLDDLIRKFGDKKPVTEEIGTAGVRQRYPQYPSHGLTPERLSAIFKEADGGHILRQAEMFMEMEEKDAHLGGILQTRRLAVSGLEWEVQPASDSAEDKKIADAGREAIEYIRDLDDHILNILDSIGKGFSVNEIMWEISEGQAWIEDLKWQDPGQFTFYSRDRVLEMPRILTSQELVYGEELIPNKYIVSRPKARSGVTPRGGLLRPCTWMYIFKNYAIKDWSIFLERFAMPMRVGKYGPGASEIDRKVLRDAVLNLGADAAAVISESTKIEFLESDGKRASSDLYERKAEYCDKAMSKAVLGHTGSSDSTPGKLGGEDQAADVRQDILEADAKHLEKVIRFQVLGPWVGFNYGQDKGVPKFKLRYEGDEDLEKTAKVYGSLVRDVGFEGIPVSHIHERFGIPQAKGGEETVKPPASGAQTPFEAKAPACPGCGATSRMAMSARLAHEKEGAEGADDVDRMTERLMRESGLDELTARVEAVIATSSSLEEAYEKLDDLIKDPEMDITVMGNKIQQALTAAELTGRFRVSDD